MTNIETCFIKTAKVLAMLGTHKHSVIILYSVYVESVLFICQAGVISDS